MKEDDGNNGTAFENFSRPRFTYDRLGRRVYRRPIKPNVYTNTQFAAAAPVNDQNQDYNVGIRRPISAFRAGSYQRNRYTQTPKSVWRPGDSTYAGIPGFIRRDFPGYNSVPFTGFRCDQVPGSGYYADVNSGCQVRKYLHVKV